MKNKFDNAINQLLIKTTYMFNQRDLFYECAMEDVQRPVFLPEMDMKNHSSHHQRQLAIASGCRLWFDEETSQYPKTGCLSSSNETIALAKAYNDSKTAFKEQIQLIRALGNEHKLNKHHAKSAYFIEQLLLAGGRRNETLIKSFKTLGIERLDLQKCYTKIRILPPKLESVSWTWAKSHSEIHQVSYGQVLDICKELAPDDPIRIRALSQLSKLSQNEKLAYKRQKKPQLRANITFTENNNIQRKAITVSGILLTSNETLPRFRWPNDNDQTRLNRIDRSIEDEVFIQGLHLYRYKKLD